MTRSDDGVRLRHMLDHAREAVELCRGRSRGDLDSDRLFGLAMTRIVEIVGEAAARVSEQTRGQYPQIPWSQIIGARNRLIHGYDQINPDILWDILELDMPSLAEKLNTILEAES